MKQAADAESYFHLHSNSNPQLHPRIILKLRRIGSHGVMDLKPHGQCSLVQGPCASASKLATGKLKKLQKIKV